MNVSNFFQPDLQHAEAQDLLQIATQELYNYLGEFAAPDLRDDPFLNEPPPIQQEQFKASPPSAAASTKKCLSKKRGRPNKHKHERWNCYGGTKTCGIGPRICKSCKEMASITLLGLRTNNDEPFDRVIKIIRQQAIDSLQARHKIISARRVKLDELEEGLKQQEDILMRF